MKTAIVTDSTCAPSRDLVRSLAITVVPITILLEGKVYRDSIDLPPEELYRMLPALNELPTTAAPAAGSFHETFTRLLKDFNHIICFTVTANLSGTYSSARQAMDGLQLSADQTVEIIDTQTAGAAAGVVVAEAARMAATGAAAAQIIEQARAMIPHARLIAFVDTLEYLKRSGRVKKLAALAGEFFRIKPVFYLNRGQVTAYAKTRGKRQALCKIMEAFRQDIAGANRVWVAVTHADADAASGLLLREISSSFPELNIDVVPFTVAMGAHTGPGVVGIGYTYL